MKVKHRYFVDKGNNSRLIKRQFYEEKGWQPASGPSKVAALNGGKGLLKITDVPANFLWTRYRSKINYGRVLLPKGGPREVLVNHFEKNYYLVSKAGLLQTLQKYHESAGSNNVNEPFWPETYYVGNSLSPLEQVRSPAFGRDSCRYWIVKPASGTNRGKGIQLAETWKEVQEVVSRSQRECIVQKYIERPLLIGKQRKFDIRCFVLLNGTEGYLHKLCYARTSVLKYSLKNLSNKAIHLTNDAVQKHHRNYGMFEPGNKLSMRELSQQIQALYGHEDAVARVILREIRQAVKATLAAAVARGLSVCGKLPKRARLSCFELFGFDFLVDTNLKVYLLEVNQNPCLEQTSIILEKYVRKVVEDLFDIVLRPFTDKTAQEDQEKTSREAGDNQFERVV